MKIQIWTSVFALLAFSGAQAEIENPGKFNSNLTTISGEIIKDAKLSGIYQFSPDPKFAKQAICHFDEDEYRLNGVDIVLSNAAQVSGTHYQIQFSTNATRAKCPYILTHATLSLDSPKIKWEVNLAPTAFAPTGPYSDSVPVSQASPMFCSPSDGYCEIDKLNSVYVLTPNDQNIQLDFKDVSTQAPAKDSELDETSVETPSP